MLRIVKTKIGTVEGIPAADPRITAFKSIPFSKSPECPYDSFLTSGLRASPQQSDMSWNRETTNGI